MASKPQQTQSGTYVLYDADDARAFLAGKHGADKVMTLSPSAQAVLVEADYKGSVDTSLNGSSYWQSSKVLLRSLRQTDLFVQAMREQRDITDAEIWVARYAFESFGYGVLRLAATLTGGPWWIRSDNEFAFVADKMDAVVRLTAIIQLSRNEFFDEWHPYRKPMWPGLYRGLRQVLLSILKRRQKKILVQRNAHPFGLIEALQHTSRRTTLCHLSAYADGYREYGKLLREIWRATTGSRFVQVRGCMEFVPAVAQSVRTALKAVDDPYIRAAAVLIEDRLATTCAVVSGFRQDIKSIVSALNPDSYFAFEHAEGYSAAIASACGDANVPRVIVNHNSHTLPVRPLDWPAMRYIFEVQYAPALTDIFYVWHREAEAVAKRILPEERWSEIRRIHRPNPGVALRQPGTGATKRVLYAGNTLRWFHFHPWMYETTDEFILGMRTLCIALRELGDIDFILRLKKVTTELDPDAIRTLIPEMGDWGLHIRRSRPFLDDLAEANLLVCDMSTTIMQALSARIPVLLWGGARRYRHLRPMTSLPTANNRAAVYSADDPGQLAQLVRSIMIAHDNRPLTDEEIAPYFFFPDEAQTVGEAANGLADLNVTNWSSRKLDKSPPPLQQGKRQVTIPLVEGKVL